MKKCLFALFFFSLVAQADPIRDVLDKQFWDADDQSLKQAIQANRLPLSDWLQKIQKDKVEFVCFGETHEDFFREYYGKKIFSKMKIDQLFLEGVTEEILAIEQKYASGVQDINFLGANIQPVLKAVKEQGSSTKIYGVEMTKKQKTAITFEQVRLDRQFLSREGFIAQNTRDVLQSEGLNVMLYGALHCANNDLGLGNTSPAYYFVSKVITENKRLNVLLQPFKLNDKFSTFMLKLGLADQSFVIPDTSKIPVVSYSHIWELKRYFANYKSIIFVGKEELESF